MTFNWKTTAAGAAVIAAALLEAFLGFDIPSFSLGVPEAFAVGFGLILAKDA